MENNNSYFRNSTTVIPVKRYFQKHKQINIMHRQKIPVEQYNYRGEKIGEYKSMGVASIKTGISVPSISKACKGQNKKAGGYFWNYKE